MNQVEELVEILYQAVNMPVLISMDPKQFTSLIKKASDKDIGFVEIESVKLVIDFKWNSYSRGFFMNRFLESMVFLFSFILDIIFQN